MFDWIGSAISAVTWAIIIAKYPGILMILAGALLAIVMTWKHKQGATEWKFNPKQLFDGVIGFVVLYLLGVGSWLTFFSS